jgi:hypothetical protein
MLSPEATTTRTPASQPSSKGERSEAFLKSAGCTIIDRLKPVAKGVTTKIMGSKIDNSYQQPVILIRLLS